MTATFPRAADSADRPARRFPHRLMHQVYLHLLQNYANASAPLILAISGPAGEGKSCGVLTLLRHLGVEVHSLSCGEFESPEAGEPARRVREVYSQAVRAMAVGAKVRDGRASKATPLAAILIDDFDVALGHWSELTQNTVNTQLVLGELMALADNPMAFAGPRRVPLILIGNNLLRIYPPLLRPGRATLLEWVLSLEEKTYSVGGMFPALCRQEVAELCEHFLDENLAFFAAVRQRCQARALQRLTASSMCPEMLRKAAMGRLVLPEGGRMTLSNVIQMGETLIHSRRLQNHLEQEIP